MQFARSLAVAACALFTAAAAPFATAADPWPNHPIRLLVGFPPGGSTDLSARALAAKLTQSLGQTIIVENKAGASGNIAADAVAHAPPDGYTFLVAATSFAAAPAFFDKLGWDPLTDFTPVSLIATVPILVVTTPSLPLKTLPELVAYSKAHPHELNLASPGATTLTRLSGETFRQVAGLDWVTVNYKGGAPAMQDMLSGRAHVMFANISDVISQVRAGKLDALAVTTAKRTAVIPNVPTLAESGYPGFAFGTWQAIVGPKGVSPAIVERLNAAIRDALATPDLKAQFLTLGIEAEASSPQALSELLTTEVAKIDRVAKSVHATRN